MSVRVCGLGDYHSLQALVPLTGKSLGLSSLWEVLTEECGQTVKSAACTYYSNKNCASLCYMKHYSITFKPWMSHPFHQSCNSIAKNVFCFVQYISEYMIRAWLLLQGLRFYCTKYRTQKHKVISHSENIELRLSKLSLWGKQPGCYCACWELW